MAFDNGGDDTQITITADTSQAEQAAQSLDDKFSQLRTKLGQMSSSDSGGVPAFEQTLAKLAETAGSVVGAFGLAAAAFTAFGAIVTVIDDKLAKAGDRAVRLGDAFVSLGGSSQALKAAENATDGLVLQTNLLIDANKLLNAGVPKINENLGLIAEVGAKLGVSLGKTATEGVDAVTNALQRAAPRMLQSYGLHIEAKKAEDDFAKSIGTTADQLSAYGRKVADQTAILDALKKKNEELAPIVDTVTSAHEKASNAFTKLIVDTGKVVDRNKDLIASTLEVRDAWSKGWETSNIAILGAEIGAFFVDLKADLINIGKWINNWIDETIGDAIKSFELLKEIGSNPFRSWSELLTAAGKDYQDLETAGVKAASNIKANTDPLIEANDKLEKSIAKIIDDFQTKLSVSGGQFGNIKDAWAQTFATQPIDEATKSAVAFLKSIDAMDIPIKQKEALIRDFASQIDAGFKQAQKNVEAFNKSLADLPNKLQAIGGRNSTTPLSGDLIGGGTAILPSLQTIADRFDDVFKSNDYDVAVQKVNDLVNVYLDGLNPALQSTIDLQNKLEKAAEDSAHTAAQEMQRIASDARSAISSVFDGLGQALTLVLNSKLDLSSLSSLGTSVGGSIGKSIGDAILPGIGGPLGQALGGKLGGDLGKGKLNLGEQVALALPTAGLSFFSNSILGGLFGNGNPDTNARKDFDKWINNLIDTNHIQGIINGKLQDIHFKFPSLDSLNSGTFDDKLSQLPPGVAAGFQGVGDALSALEGKGQDLGGRIAAGLNDSVGGSLSNLQNLIAGLGVSFDQLGQAIIQTFDQGKMTYSQAASDLQGIADLAAKGIPNAIGATNKAFDNFVAATDKGGAAGLKAIRDIGAEAQEVGIHSIEDLRKRLLAQGEDASKVSALMTALKDQGITDVQTLATTSDQRLTQIGAELEGKNFFAEASKNVDDIVSKLDKINNGDYTVNIHANIDPGLQKILDGTSGGSTAAGAGSTTTTGQITRALFARAGATDAAGNPIFISGEGSSSGGSSGSRSRSGGGRSTVRAPGDRSIYASPNLGAVTDISSAIANIVAGGRFSDAHVANFLKNFQGDDFTKSVVGEGLGISHSDIVSQAVASFLSGGTDAASALNVINGNGFGPIDAASGASGALSKLFGYGTKGGRFSLDSLKAIANQGEGSSFIKTLIAARGGTAGTADIANLAPLLQSQGASSDVAGKLVAALGQEGIKTFDDLKNVSDETGVKIIGDLQKAQLPFQQTSKQVSDLLKQIQQLSGEKQITIKYNVVKGKVEIDSNTAALLTAMGLNPSKFLPGKPRTTSQGNTGSRHP